MMNAETIELLSPYINLENFNAATAKSASNAAEGLCKFCVAMKFYYEASKLIAPKLEALQVAEGQLAEAHIQKTFTGGLELAYEIGISNHKIKIHTRMGFRACGNNYLLLGTPSEVFEMRDQRNAHAHDLIVF